MLTMTTTRKLLIVLLLCAGVASLTGPAGRMVVVLSFLLFGPGYLVEALLTRYTASAQTEPPQLAVFIRPTLWLGLSISVIVVLYAWVTLVGLTLNATILEVLTLLCAVGVAWQLWQAPAEEQTAPGSRAIWLQAVLAGGGLLLIFGLTLWLRFYEVRDLVLPAWVDSVHHALLVRVAAEQGQAPYSLHPYMPIENLPYHWGYHVFTATVVQLSGLDIPQTMLWGGQLLNGLHVLTCAGLAAFFWRRPETALTAGVVVGLVSIMPAYYASWGRYTQLTGLLLLPPIAIAWWRLLQRPEWAGLVISALLLAGLSMVHFRVLLFALALLGVLTLVWAAEADWTTLHRQALWVVAAGAGALVLAGPWIGYLVLATLAPSVDNPQDIVGGGSYNAMKEGLLWVGENRALVALALLSAFWGVLQRARPVIVFIGWVAALFVLANPLLLNYLLPLSGLVLLIWGAYHRKWLALVGAGPLLLVNPWLLPLPFLALVTNEVVIISLFLPLSVLIGGGVWLLIRWLQEIVPAPGLLVNYAIVGVICAAGFWDAWRAPDILNPVTILVDQADVEAIQWIDANTPADARFLINAQIWYPHVDRGVDGGWWLLPLTGRWTTTPPAIYDYGGADYVQEVHTLSRSIADLQADQPEQVEQLYDLIEREGITHIYVRAEATPLSPELFVERSGFERIYEQDGVTIIAVERAAS